MKNELNEVLELVSELKELVVEYTYATKPRRIAGKVVRPPGLSSTLYARAERLINAINECEAFRMEQPAEVNIIISEAVPKSL